MFKDLVNCLIQVSEIRSSLSKVNLLNLYFTSLNSEELAYVLFILDPRNDTKKQCNISEKLLCKVVTDLTNIKVYSNPELNYRLHYVDSENQSIQKSQYTYKQIVEFVIALSQLKGKDSIKLKSSLIKQILTKTDLKCGVYIIKLLTADFRTGTSTNLLLKSLAIAKNIQYSILKQKYNLGCSITTILDEFTNIIYRPMLAKPYTHKLHSKLNLDEYIYEYKYDGIRLIVSFMGNILKLYSRNSLELNLQSFLVNLIKFTPNENIILDCELLGVDFQTIITIVKRKYDIGKYKDLKLDLKIFDILNYKDVACIDLQYQSRKLLLQNWCTQNNNTSCFVQSFPISTYVDLVDLLKSQTVSNYEGLILKKINAKYTLGKRTNDWLKLKKEVFEGDFLVLSAVKGSGFKEKWYTSFLLAAKTEDNKLIPVGYVGTGLSESSLDFITAEIIRLTISQTKNIAEISPQLVFQVKFQEVQYSASKDTFALRFPVYMSIRPDKTKDEITTLLELKNLCST